MTCRDVTDRATDYAEGALDPDARRSFEAHLSTCPACRTWVGQLQLTSKIARSIPPPELTAEAREALLRRFDAWAEGRPHGAAPARGERGLFLRLRWEVFFASAGVVAVLVGAARHPSRAPADWLVALALAALAIGLTAVARRLTLRFALSAISAALVAAVIRGGSGPLEVPMGLDCLLTEAAGAAAVVTIGWLGSRWRRMPASAGVWAAAGAVAGDAALQITCASSASLAHAAVFHAGGVLAVIVVALAARRTRRTA